MSNSEEEYVHKLIDEFEYEDNIKGYYQKNSAGVDNIIFDQFEELKGNKNLHLFLDAKETTTVLNLKREVIMTMLNSLEKLPEAKKFFKFEGVLPSFIGLRFHKTPY